MTILIPLLSLVGPIYFGARGFSLIFVLAWAAIWTVLRFLVEWKSVYASLQQHDRDKPLSWIDRHPYVLVPIVFLATLMIFEVVHVAVYWIIQKWA
jgi:hypothetical protein